MQLYGHIDVDDVDKAIAFYSAGLGLTLSRRLFDGAVAETLGDPFGHGLCRMRLAPGGYDHDS